jgi:two-component system response regulator ChvI
MSALSKAIVAVVDDDARLRRSVGQLLEAYGYTVSLFSSGLALVEREDLSAFCCVVADIGMPHMDGFELLKALKVRVPALPVVLITGRDQPSDEHLARAGATPFFENPLILKPFWKALPRALERDPRIPPMMASNRKDMPRSLSG